MGYPNMNIAEIFYAQEYVNTQIPIKLYYRTGWRGRWWRWRWRWRSSCCSIERTGNGNCAKVMKSTDVTHAAGVTDRHIETGTPEAA